MSQSFPHSLSAGPARIAIREKLLIQRKRKKKDINAKRAVLLVIRTNWLYTDESNVGIRKGVIQQLIIQNLAFAAVNTRTAKENFQ